MSAFIWHPCLGVGGMSFQRSLGPAAFDVPDSDEPGGDVVYLQLAWDNGSTITWASDDSMNWAA